MVLKLELEVGKMNVTSDVEDIKMELCYTDDEMYLTDGTQKFYIDIGELNAAVITIMNFKHQFKNNLH